MDARRDGAPGWPDARLIVKDRTGSTMDDALALGNGGCASGSVVAARFQDAGRGRVPGRTWLSPAGESLLATVVVRAGELSFPFHEIPFRAGLAVARAVETQAGVPVEIKWPNDIMVNGRKLSGLLCEMHGAVVLVGFGINCNQSSFPPEIADTAISLLQATGEQREPLDLLPAVLLQLRHWMSADDWLTPIRSRLYRRGMEVSVDLLGSGRTLQGIISGIDNGGRLLLQAEDGSIQRIAQGEIKPGL